MSAGDDDLQDRLQRLEAAIHAMEQGVETPARAHAREIVRGVLDLHASGLARLMQLAADAGAPGAALADRFARDPLIAALLLLHGLHPHDLETRVRAALDGLEPMLQSQGARLALLSLAGGAVRLGLEREGGRGGLSPEALRLRVEQAIVAAAPDAAGVQIDGPATIAAFVPVEQVRMRPSGARRP